MKLHSWVSMLAVPLAFGGTTDPLNDEICNSIQWDVQRDTLFEHGIMCVATCICGCLFNMWFLNQHVAAGLGST